MAPYLFKDEKGIYTINELDRGIFRFNKYFKNYKDGQRVEITEKEFLENKAEGEALYGTTDWKGEFVPGILRPTLPVIEYDSNATSA